MSAMRGARGRESMYAPNDPNEVINVNKTSAGNGLSRDPTRMF
jgi:hypothetical protein